MSMTENPAVKVLMTRQVAGERLKDNDVPLRSKLYGLVPCGLGTVWQESLTSYLNRLAGLHHVSPLHLAAQEIVPHLTQGYSRQQLSVFSWSTSMSVNGNGPLAREWASILEGLTKRSDLHFLTLQWWVSDLPSHKLLREKPAWCPMCYAEWKDQKTPIYEPLLWIFPTVTMCMKHLCKLEEYCPSCGKRQSFIRFQTALDQCVRCHTWLGSCAPALLPAHSEALEWQRWVIHALEELRSVMVSSALPPWEQFFMNLSRSCEGRGEQSRLAGLVGVARGQLATWLRRSHTPTLQSILEFCYVCNVTPLQILTGNLTVLKQVIAEGKAYRSPRARRSVRSVDREHCLERIQAILDGREEPLGYVQLAQQLGYGGNILLYHFPQECAKLSQQIKEYRRQRKEQRLAQVQEEVRQAMLSLHAQGIYPSQNKVADLLSDPNLLFQPEAKATWRTFCQELGWDHRRIPPL
ncbi:MAG: TniQ family protein [Chloroflexi bacterium]|nr:MAG: TniQ family protein [Chloroflexota bacterium]